MEYNCINWSAIEYRLEQQKVRWCTAESRDGWAPKESAPMVCMHQSYKNQKVSPDWVEGASDNQSGTSLATSGWTHHTSQEDPVQMDGQNLLKALQGDGKAMQCLQTHLGQAPAQGTRSAEPAHEVVSHGKAEASNGTSTVEEVPMYVFLDASAVRRMMNREEGLFSFQGLLNLCQQGHMKCTPPDDRTMPAWLGAVEERDRIIFVVTDSVLDELDGCANLHPGERTRIEWLRTASDSYLQLCHSWGILEVLETSLHTQLMKLNHAHEQRARDMRISKKALMMFDFACLWAKQIESEGHVLFVTADEALNRFGSEVVMTTSNSKQIVVLHSEVLDWRFASDHTYGGARLCEAARKSKVSKFCGSILSAQLITSALVLHALHDPSLAGASEAGSQEVDCLRRELREAMALLANARQLLGQQENRAAGSAIGAEARDARQSEVQKCIEKMDETQKRWQLLLARGRPTSRRGHFHSSDPG